MIVNHRLPSMHRHSRGVKRAPTHRFIKCISPVLHLLMNCTGLQDKKQALYLSKIHFISFTTGIDWDSVWLSVRPSLCERAANLSQMAARFSLTPRRPLPNLYFFSSPKIQVWRSMNISRTWLRSRHLRKGRSARLNRGECGEGVAVIPHLTW